MLNSVKLEFFRVNPIAPDNVSILEKRTDKIYIDDLEGSAIDGKLKFVHLMDTAFIRLSNSNIDH